MSVGFTRKFVGHSDEPYCASGSRFAKAITRLVLRTQPHSVLCTLASLRFLSGSLLAEAEELGGAGERQLHTACHCPWANPICVTSNQVNRGWPKPIPVQLSVCYFAF